jgi:hypothetical protein
MNKTNIWAVCLKYAQEFLDAASPIAAVKGGAV